MLRTLLVLTILVPGFVLALRDRFMALLLYLWFAFFRPQDWMWIDMSGLRVSLVLGVVLVVPALFSGILPNLTHRLSIGTLLFLGTALVAQLNAVDQATGWAWIDFLARLTLVCLLAVSLVTTPKRAILVLAVVSGSLGFHAAKAGLASLLGGGLLYGDGLAGAFVDNNGYALGAVIIIPWLLAVSLNADVLVDGKRAWMAPWIRRGFIAAVPLCAFTVISTFSRGGFLALVTVGLVYIGLHQRRARLALVMTALIAIGLTLAPIPDGYIRRLQTITTYEDIGEESALGRKHFWEVAQTMADAQPFGIGLWNFEATYDAYDFLHGRYGTRRAVHSSHFQVLAELGYAGALVWVTQFGMAFWIAWRIRWRARAPGLSFESARFMSTVSNCLMASMAGFLVGGSFISLALNDVTWLTFALLAAIDRMTPGLMAGTAATPPPVALSSLRKLPPWRPAVRAARQMPRAGI